MSKDAFSTLMSSTDAPLIVVTTAAEGQMAGCLVGFHSQSSISGQQYSLWLSKANHTYRASLRASHFAVHFLTTGDVELAEHFGTLSGDDVDKFADLTVETGPGDVPLISALPHRMVVERIAVLDDGGDHVCVTTRVLSAQAGGTFTPLRPSDIGHLVPGHDSDERAIHP